MVERPEDFIVDATKGIEEVSLSEVKKMKRKANKAKAQEDKSRSQESQAQNAAVSCTYSIQFRTVLSATLLTLRTSVRWTGSWM